LAETSTREKKVKLESGCTRRKMRGMVKYVFAWVGGQEGRIGSLGRKGDRRLGINQGSGRGNTFPSEGEKIH